VHRIGSNDTRGPALAVLDVNWDGRVDVVQAPNEGAQGRDGLIWWQAPADRRSGVWIRHTIDSSWQRVHWINDTDIDRDGHADLVVAEQEQSHDPPGGPYSFTNDRVAVFYSSGNGNFMRQILHRTGGHNQAVADLDGDGDIDILNANHGVYGAPNPIELFINQLR
jgi:FG-GAP-like repeat